MTKWAIAFVALTTATAAHAEQQAVVTGSPSAGTATISPSSVSEAVGRSAASDSSFDVSLGTSIASGDFGSAADTSIWSTALGVRYAMGNGLRLSASVPYMRIRSNGTIFTGIDSTPVVVSLAVPGHRTVHDGLGDLTLGASYTVAPSDSGIELELSGRVKLPTASDSSQLSTGKVDYSGGLQVTKTFGRFAPFVSATYRVFGDTPAFDLKNGFAASVGSSVIVGDRTVLLFSYHFAQAATDFVPNSHELFAGASTLVGGNRLRLTSFVTAGLSSGAAAVSGGLAASIKL